MKEVKSIKVKEEMKVKELVSEMSGMGFGAGKIAKASSILKEMVTDKECKIFLGVAGAMVPAGMKQVIIDLINKSEVFVTTGANLTHDLIESLGDHHYIMDKPVSDEELNKQGLDRIYNVLMKNSVYEKLEQFFERNWEKLKTCTNIKELLWKIGELCPGNGILKTCSDKQIPIFCPALADSGIGLMIWGRLASGKQISIDAFFDMKEIIDIAWTSKKNGVIYIGGGTPKNFIQQSLQFAKGANYGIQITTDRQEPGGSSGAPLVEGISWGKMKNDGKFVDVFCDATIAMPLILASIK
ncbi:deoxyhypusine synthase family protein [Candidatus Pacearchaeota archaeon]|nr:deoxyhypusine synthase family protein [Candidatus Pacearchaeota archaeon]